MPSDPVAGAFEIVVDTATGALAEHVANPVLEPTIRAIKALLFPRWSGAFSAIQLNLQEHVRRAQERDADFVARLDRAMERGEAGSLVASFVRAAAQATTDERMDMLAAAAAGVFTPDLGSELRSRVARAVAAMEPRDVVSLREVSVAGGSILVPEGNEESARLELRDTVPPLLQAGCVRPVPVFGGLRYTITPTGRGVLEALRCWKRTAGRSAARG